MLSIPCRTGGSLTRNIRRRGLGLHRTIPWPASEPTSAAVRSRLSVGQNEFPRRHHWRGLADRSDTAGECRPAHEIRPAHPMNRRPVDPAGSLELARVCRDHKSVGLTLDESKGPVANDQKTRPTNLVGTELRRQHEDRRNRTGASFVPTSRRLHSHVRRAMFHRLLAPMRNRPRCPTHSDRSATH